MRYSSRWALAALCAIMLAEGAYAVFLSHEFYRQHIPIFDSCAYANHLADVFSYAHSHGVAASLRTGVVGGNVALPWLEALALAPMVGVSRELCVWLQWIWLLALALSLYWYLTRYRNVPPWRALCLTLPFAWFESALHWAGGLPDFRMDLSLYIFLALTSVWFLVARESGSRGAWLLTGVSGSLACLARATAPIYLLVMLGPLITVELMRAPRRTAARLGWLLAPFAPALWYLIVDYRELHFYYVEWSPDANRHLPLGDAALHLVLGVAHLGIPLALAAAAVFALSVRRQWRGRAWAFDWSLLWLALAPSLLLTLRGAGLNPYVSMPCVFGTLIFAFFPLRETVAGGPVTRLQCALLAAACLATAATVEVRHPFRGVDATSGAELRSLTNRMIADARARGWRDVSYAIPEIGDFHSCGFANSLIYDYRGRPENGGVRIPSGMTLRFPQEGVFTASDTFLWTRLVPGDTDARKMDYLCRATQAEHRYLMLPSEGSLPFFERQQSLNLCNLKVREFKRRVLATGRYQKVGEAFAISPDERIELYVRAR